MYTFLYIDIPDAPLNVKATVFENDCKILVKWDPPANSIDISSYMVYNIISSIHMDTNTTFLLSFHHLRDCPESVSVKVAAINRFGCIGINSSEVYVRVAVQPTTTSTSTSISTSTSTFESPESSKYNYIM